MVHKSAKILNYLVRDMLDLTNIINDKFKPTISKFKPYLAARKIMSCYKECAEVKNILL